jgi:hypothetical protein
LFSPEEPEPRLLNEVKENFVRIWKTSICSVLLAQDESIAEALADRISGFVTVVSQWNTTLLSIFTERFFVTLAQEWVWIDPLITTIFASELIVGFA